MSKKLIAYFSASGTTKKVAEMISEAAGADLYEIKPKELYTKADLDWMNKKSRSSVEMSDKKIRPELDDSNAHIENYDEIVLGFPTTSQARRSHCLQHRAEVDWATRSRNSSRQHRELSL